jgi:D-alanyl-D-alanine carboxypeptidase
MAWRSPDSRIFRFVRLAAGTLIAASALVGGAADAHAYRRLHHHHSYAHFHSHRLASHHRGPLAVPASPVFSAIVVDANSGRTLYSVAEDGLRHPASVTKVMTLYLLFEQLDKGAMTLQTRIPVSEHAAAQEPSKLGVEPGDTISVDDAIKAVVTRSANDIAVAIAEAIGHDESTFAEMMTSKAHSLGMSNTLYRNASGLPNDEQLTSARDLSILGRSLEERFPRYFKYFSTREFEYAGETIGSHNHLLGRVDGVDGIKTGYTRASGFNLLTSVHRDGRSLIAVVMGGRSAAGRDRIMENLIDDHLAEASTVHTATLVETATNSEAPQPPVSEPRAAAPRPSVVAASVPARLPSARAAPAVEAEGDDSDGDASADSAPTLRVAAVDRRRVASLSAGAAPHSDRTPAERGWVKGADPASARKSGATGDARTKVSAPASAADDGDGGGTGKGWIIQVGATDNAAKASALLDRARQRSRPLLAAKPVTEKVRKGDETLYRARFAGLDSASAQTACRSLKRDGFSCFVAHD